MGICSHCGKVHNVGIVATRLAGTDGVSLEAEKWAQVFATAGFNCFYFAGELDTPEAHSCLIPEAHFRHPDILDIYQHCFGVQKRSIQVTEKIHRTTLWLKEQLYRFIEKFDIQLLVPENALAIPLNLPLGIALTELISETAIPTIAHHHDFFWERQHFLTNAVWEYLNMAFPPHLPSIQHVVINSSADNQLGLRTGISATVVPNVMDFDHPPAPPDAYTRDVRENLGIEEDALLVLQPTRVVKRKGIEHAVELVRRLGRKATLVISHASGDEGHDYEQRVREYSRMMGVETRFVSQIINEKRGQTEDGRKIYTLEDIYPKYQVKATGRRLTHAHNDYIEFLVNGGVVGFLLFFGFVAMITSLTTPSPRRSSSIPSPSSSGPIPSSGERWPIRTKYSPRNPVASSTAMTSAGDSTTHNWVSSRPLAEQVEHSSCSLNMRQRLQWPMPSTASWSAVASAAAPSRSRSRR